MSMSMGLMWWKSSLPEHFAFYPTRNRPSKRLKDFVATIETANSS